MRETKIPEARVKEVILVHVLTQSQDTDQDLVINTAKRDLKESKREDQEAEREEKETIEITKEAKETTREKAAMNPMERKEAREEERKVEDEKMYVKKISYN
jgi:hypothetical protein